MGCVDARPLGLKASHLQRPLPDTALIEVMRGAEKKTRATLVSVHDLDEGGEPLTSLANSFPGPRTRARSRSIQLHFRLMGEFDHNCERVAFGKRLPSRRRIERPDNVAP